MKRFITRVLAATLVFALALPFGAFADKGKPKKKKNFFQKVGQGIHQIGHKINNGAKDTYVAAKKKVTGKKDKVWVCGHFDKNGKHVKGHWRKIKHGQSGQPGQGGQSGQSGQGGEPPAPPAPPAEPPAPPAEPPAPPAEPPAEPPAPPAEPPAEPPAPPPADPGQGGDQSGQGGQGKMTMSGLVTDLVELSDDMDEVKGRLVKAKKTKTKSVDVKGLEADYSTLVEEREQDTRILAKVVIWDLNNNKGNPGVYYQAFMRNMKGLSKADRNSISDVVDSVTAQVKHKATQTKSKAWKARAAELAKY